jgi:hypothetical protein
MSKPDTTDSVQHVQNKLNDAPLGQRSNNKTFQNSSPKVLELCSIQASPQSDCGTFDKVGQTLEENNAVLESNSGCSEKAAANDLGPFSAKSNYNKSDDAGIDHEDPPVGEKRLTEGSMLKEIKYSGRFFDLNEEVERELGQEDMSNEEFNNVLEDIEEESNLQDFSSEVAVFDATKSKLDGFIRSSGSAPFSEVKHEATTKAKLNHPPIPRLNLSKSVRKGGPAIKLDTAAELEFPSSRTSTWDSKFRPNAVFELQQELHKEVRSSDINYESYETGCLQRRLYRHVGLHVLLLELFVSLMLTPQLVIQLYFSKAVFVALF